MVESDPKTNKIVRQYYRAWCTVCMFTVNAKDEFTARKSIIAHIVSHHKDRWLNHRGELVEDK
jgi:hypothetical protein